MKYAVFRGLHKCPVVALGRQPDNHSETPFVGLLSALISELCIVFHVQRIRTLPDCLRGQAPSPVQPRLMRLDATVKVHQ
ncbi:uncharacterized protein BKA55DRAFT_579196 [Fusarium redolens]|uniref:Uncharacterized protein n=1 Tax=Fusarium redolens TaxID=48865 RepID=A0A9P9JR29_FUSRE|nr:uncharacterized protein BKA55DRAFT_579196 [Fusarium redolens]KAH7234612.1 hypothetical protein BKA55DRAFT_579196 [Fusarium redolens]